MIGRRIGTQYDRAVALDSANIEAAEARLDFYLNAPGIVGGGADKARAEVARIQRISTYAGAFARAKFAEKSKDSATMEKPEPALRRRHRGAETLAPLGQG
jgi:hypothetical protein